MVTKIKDCDHCDGELLGGIDIQGLEMLIRGWCLKCGYVITERARSYIKKNTYPIITDFSAIMKRFNRRIGV